MIEAWTNTYSSPYFTGDDGIYDESLFSNDSCSTCINSHPCASWNYALEQCDSCCGANGIYDIKIGCTGSGFDPNSMIGTIVSLNGCCYTITSYDSVGSNGQAAYYGTFMSTCEECQNHYPCPSPTPTPTPTITPSATPNN